MFFIETKWKDCTLIVITLIVTSQIKPFGLIHTSSGSCVHCCLLVGRCGWWSYCSCWWLGGNTLLHRSGWCLQLWRLEWCCCCRWLSIGHHCWSWDDGCSVASDSPLLCFDDAETGATGRCDNLAGSLHVPDPDWITWLEWRKFSCGVSLVEVEMLFFFVGHLFCFDGIMIRCCGFQGLGKNGNSGFELPSHEKFARGKAVLKWSSPVHEEGKVGILVILQQLFYGLYCSLCFTTGLGVFGWASHVSEAVWGGKFSKVLTAELSAVVRHNNIWGSVGCKHTIYLVDSLCASLLDEELSLDPSGIIVNDGQVGPATEFEEVHPEACLWTIWEGWRKKGFLSLWMVYGACRAFVYHLFYVRWDVRPPNWGPCQSTALGDSEMTFMKTVEGVKFQASGNDQVIV